MKLGILSDIHGNFSALKASLHFFEGKVDKLLFLGDISGYYPFVEECISMIPWDITIGIVGNHDVILLNYLNNPASLPANYQVQYGSALVRSAEKLSKKSREKLMSLPTTRVCSVGDISICMVHGTPWDVLNGRVYPDFQEWDRFGACPADIILIGHTHYPLKREMGNKLVINPGSVGQPRDGNRNVSVAELDLYSRRVQFHRISYDPSAIIDDARIHDPNTPYLVQVLR
jgi:putative phosphoesterase